MQRPAPVNCRCKPSIGRPGSISQQIAEQICERLAHGETLISICADPDMPGSSSVYRLIEANEKFREQYRRARELQAHYHADQVTEIALATLEGQLDPQAARVALQALQWRTSKPHPKTYSDRVDHRHEHKINIGSVVQELQQRRAERLASEDDRLAIETPPLLSDGAADRVRRESLSGDRVIAGG